MGQYATLLPRFSSRKNCKPQKRYVPNLSSKQQVNVLLIVGFAFLQIIFAAVILNFYTRNNDPLGNTVSKELPSPSTQEIKQNLTVTASITINQDWVVYKNSKYNFEIRHPAGSSTEERYNGQYQYIRIQNYNDETYDYKTGLAPGQYYLEIFLYDHSLGNDNTQSCNDMLINSSMINLGSGIQGYRGLGLGGGDSAKHIYALCINLPDVDYYLQASENHEAVANKIIKSFKLTD